MLTENKITLAAAVIPGAAGVAEVSTMDQAFTVAQASTGPGTTGRPGTTTSSPQSGVNPNNSQDMTVPRARNPLDLAR